MRGLKIYSLILVLVMSFSGVLFAQEEHDGYVGDTLTANIDIFEDPNPMNITLTLDLKQYQGGKFEGEYVPVDFLYRFNDTLEIKKSFRIKARGAFRREYCSFAPFWLNISKDDVTNEHLQDVKKMKVVTQCNRGESYSEYVLKEYLTYKIYNLLTPVSFRVRLIHMKFVDTGRKNKVTENWGFLIEPEEMLAARHGGNAIENDQISIVYMRPGEMDLAALFLYMIGNSDYSVAGRHNIKILGLSGFGTEGYTPVPYDFDYSGIVNADYAIPGPNLGITSVTERYFLGPCRENEAFQKAIDHIEAHREEILALVADFPYLEPNLKKEMIGYLESYFISASDPKFINSKLKKTCR